MNVFFAAKRARVCPGFEARRPVCRAVGMCAHLGASPSHHVGVAHAIGKRGGQIPVCDSGVSLPCGIYFLAARRGSVREFVATKALGGVAEAGGIDHILFVAGLGIHASGHLGLVGIGPLAIAVKNSRSRRGDEAETKKRPPPPHVVGYTFCSRVL